MGPQTEKEAAAAAAAGVVAANAESGAAAGEADGTSSSSRQPTALKINTSGQKGKYGVRIVHACLPGCLPVRVGGCPMSLSAWKTATAFYDAQFKGCWLLPYHA